MSKIDELHTDLLLNREQLQIDLENNMKDLETVRSSLRLPMYCCGKSYKIGNIEAIQSYWYEGPHGCTGGDIWHEGEMQYRCPQCGMIHRILEGRYEYELPYEKRRKYINSPAQQFKRLYKHLFKSITDETGENCSNFINVIIDKKFCKKFKLTVADLPDFP